MGISQITRQAKNAFTTKEGFLSMIHTRQSEVIPRNGVSEDHVKSNADLDPTPAHERRWGSWYIESSTSSMHLY